VELIVFLQHLEPQGLFRLVFSVLGWCGDGPLYFLLFPLLYWRQSPTIAIRYGYLWGFAVLVMTVCKEQANTLRPFVVSPDYVAFLKYPLEGLYWFPHQDALMEAYRHSPSLPSGHALFSTALGMYLRTHIASRGVRWTLVFFMVMIPLARLYLGVHYPADVLAGSGLGLALFLLTTRVRWQAIARQLAPWGFRGWRRPIILGITLGSILACVSQRATFVWLVLLSYPLILHGTEPYIQAFAAKSDRAWRNQNTVWGCLGVGIILWTTAPLLSLGSLLSVPLVTVWVPMGCPLLVQSARNMRRTLR